MKACLDSNDVLGCGATGLIFGGIKPFRFAWCIRCKGTGFVSGKPIEPAEIKMPNLGTTTKAEAHIFTLAEFANIKTPLLAHVMAKAGVFPSVGQARKNGWNKPLTTGVWTVTKKKIKIEVIA